MNNKKGFIQIAVAVLSLAILSFGGYYLAAEQKKSSSIELVDKETTQNIDKKYETAKSEITDQPAKLPEKTSFNKAATTTLRIVPDLSPRTVVAGTSKAGFAGFTFDNSRSNVDLVIEGLKLGYTGTLEPSKLSNCAISLINGDNLTYGKTLINPNDNQGTPFSFMFNDPLRIPKKETRDVYLNCNVASDAIGNATWLLSSIATSAEPNETRPRLPIVSRLTTVIPIQNEIEEATTITIKSPTSETKIVPGRVVDIRWQTTNPSGSNSVWISWHSKYPEGGDVVGPSDFIAEDVLDSGYYQWKVPTKFPDPLISSPLYILVCKTNITRGGWLCGESTTLTVEK